MMRSVRRRRELILGLITTTRVETQEDLVRALEAAGVEASQASVSRDIAALGLIKAGGQWSAPAPAEPVRNPAEQRIRNYLLSVAPAGPNLLVLKTPPGEAPGVGLAFDRLDLSGVVGSVAGDDTVLVAVSGARDGRAIKRHLDGLVAAGAAAGSRR